MPRGRYTRQISKAAKEALMEKYKGLDDRLWRTNNLYRILTREGLDIPFRLNWCQNILANDMWYREIVIKGRQQGISTYLQLYPLDRAFFHKNFVGGIIADTMLHAEEIFEDKLRFMYNSLPDDLKALNPLKSDSKKELVFSNGSKIRVSTSFVSGTYHYIHVSEYAAMAQESEEKATKVRRSVEAVSPKCMVIYECTTRGPGGSFEEMWNTSVNTENQILAGKRTRTPLDFKPRFFPAYKHPDNQVVDENMELTEGDEDYFRRIEEETGDQIGRGFKMFYIRKREALESGREQGGHILQEYPNTAKEAFDLVIEGQIFGPNVRKVEEEGRIMPLPHVRGQPVHVACDLGQNDATSMWLWQYDGPWANIIDCYENKLLDITHYVEIMHDLRVRNGYSYGMVYLPHDGSSRYFTSIAGSAEEIFRRNGFNVTVIPRPIQKRLPIEAARRKFSKCRFDEAKCAPGLEALRHYSYERHQNTREFSNIPKHDRWCHYADAFQTFALADDDGAEIRMIAADMEKARPRSSMFLGEEAENYIQEELESAYEVLL